MALFYIGSGDDLVCRFGRWTVGGALFWVDLTK